MMSSTLGAGFVVGGETDCDLLITISALAEIPANISIAKK
jgi:hypothetical protein